MPISILNDRIDPITINLYTYLSSRGLDLDLDIDEIIFMIKNNPTDTDASALVSLTLTGNPTQVVKVPDAADPVVNDQITISLNTTNFNALTIGSTYYFGIGLKQTEDPVFREPTLADNRITITQDFVDIV